MNTIIGALVVGAAASVATAADRPYELSDFAFAMPIETSARTPFHAVLLTETVYAHLTRADRGDLRVFDATGRVVPHIFHSAPVTVALPEPVFLPVFPLPDDVVASASGHDIHVQVDENGTIINVLGSDNSAVVSKYLLDASSVEAPVESLILRWSGEAERLLAHITVACSDNLDDWTYIATGSIADLRDAGTRLLKNDIALPPARCRYFRIDWPRTSARLEAVTAHARQGVGEADLRAQLQWLSLNGVQSADTGYEYDAIGRFPVMQLDVEWPENNTLANLIIQSRSTRDASWRSVHTGLFFGLEVDGRPMRNDPVPVPFDTARHWRISPASNTVETIVTMPRLKLGWRPDRLVFVASGTPPYRLAYGSAMVDTGIGLERPMLTLLNSRGKDSDVVGMATLGEPHEMAGMSALIPPPPSVPWQRYVFWVVLVAGVMLLARMSISLFREMEADR